MTHDDTLPGKTRREQAGRELLEGAQPRLTPTALTGPEALLHELRVHQIELEHQNEELRRALLDTEEARGRYLDLFDFAPIGYFSFDRQGLIEEANLTGCALLGAPRERLLGRRFQQFLDPESRGHFAALLRRVFETPDQRVTHLKLVRQDGSGFHVQLEAQVVGGGGPDSVRFRAAMMDTTAQKEAEQEVLRLNEALEARVQQRSAQLRDLSDELERFTHDVAGDMEAPLRHIQSFAALLRAGLTVQTLPDQEAGRHLDRIEHAAARMQTLTGALLEFSRASRMRMRLTQLPLEQVLREVRRKLEPELSARGVRLAHDPLPVVRADSGATQLVFRHLLDNALKFTRTRPDARIQVFAQETPREHVIGVRDNGVGFNMRYRDRLFGVFQRLHSERDYEGAGVGLAIVRRVVARSGGRVWAEGKVGEGATFFVALPRHPAELD